MLLRYLLLPRRYCRLMQSVKNSYTTASGGGKPYKSLPDGVWPTMITPFLNDPSKSVDWRSLDLLTDWYIKSGCAGLFAVCLSSEMFQLSNKERVEIAKRVAERADGRVPVVAGATFEGKLEEQAELMNEIGKYVDAVVIITNQICGMNESDDVWMENVGRLMDMTGDTPLGLYETPLPQVRALTPEMLAWCAGSPRFLFHKDTSVDTQLMLRKLDAVQSLPHSNLKFYTAKVQFLSTVLSHGGNGFSGVIANFFPWLPVWLCNNRDSVQGEGVQGFLSVADRVIAHKYPTSSKFYLAAHYSSMPILPVSRWHDITFDDQDIFSLESLHQMMTNLCQQLSIDTIAPN